MPETPVSSEALSTGLITPPGVAAHTVVTPERAFVRKVFIAVGISLGAILLVLFILQIAQVLALVFASVLLAVFLSTPSDMLARHFHIGRGYALAVVIAVVLLALGGLSYFIGAEVSRQVGEMRRTLPAALGNFEANLLKTDMGRWVVDKVNNSVADTPADTQPATAPAMASPATEPAPASVNSPSTAPALPPTLVEDAPHKGAPEVRVIESLESYLNPAYFFQQAGGFAFSTFGVIGNMAVVLVVGVFLAISPSLYVGGFVSLFPIPARRRTNQILEALGRTLQWWFLGQLLSMLEVGTLTFIALKIVGVPSALALALLASLLTFIPNFGPIIAAVPAVLLAMAPHGHQTEVSLFMGAKVAVAYMVVQAIDGAVISPLIQRHAVSIPPALIMLSQVTLAVLLGPLGLLLATPILAAMLVIIRMAYVEDVLGDRAAAAPHPSKAGA